MSVEEALELAYELLDQHGLTERGWTVVPDRKRRYLGTCCCGQNIITLSSLHIQQSPVADIKDTILHEIAHALVGADHGHDAIWQAKAVAIGARPSAVANFTLRKTTAIHLGDDS